MENIKSRNEFLLSIADDLIEEIIEKHSEFYQKSYDASGDFFDAQKLTLNTNRVKQVAKSYLIAEYFEEDYTYSQFTKDCEELFSQEVIYISAFTNEKEYELIDNQVLDHAQESLKQPSELELMSVGAY